MSKTILRVVDKEYSIVINYNREYASKVFPKSESSKHRKQVRKINVNEKIIKYSRFHIIKSVIDYAEMNTFINGHFTK